MVSEKSSGFASNSNLKLQNQGENTRTQRTDTWKARTGGSREAACCKKDAQKARGTARPTDLQVSLALEDQHRLVRPLVVPVLSRDLAQLPGVLVTDPVHRPRPEPQVHLMPHLSPLAVRLVVHCAGEIREADRTRRVLARQRLKQTHLYFFSKASFFGRSAASFELCHQSRSCRQCFGNGRDGKLALHNFSKKRYLIHRRNREYQPEHTSSALRQ